jgi:hypothetical protein
MVFFTLFDSKLRAQKKAEEAENFRLEFERTRQLLGAQTAFPGGLDPDEIWWRDHFLWLKDVGYQLRSRHAPDWVPSWQGTDKYWGLCEDSWQMPVRFPSWISFIHSQNVRPRKSQVQRERLTGPLSF